MGKAQPQRTTREAYEAPKAQIESALKRYQDKYGISDAKLGGSLTSFGCVGYDMGTPVLIATDFHAPTEHELKETLSDIVLPPGMLIALGAKCRLVRDYEAEDDSFHAVPLSPAGYETRIARRSPNSPRARRFRAWGSKRRRRSAG
jgi:hypothetical protein